MTIPAIWDPALATAEVRRVADQRVHTPTFTENPKTQGQPSFDDLATSRSASGLLNRPPGRHSFS